MSMRGRDFLSIRDYTGDELRGLLRLATDIKTRPAAYERALKGKTLAMIFEKPSLRTRVSFEVGIQQLGGFAVGLSASAISLGQRESVHDVAKNLERMVQAIMIRTFHHATVEEMAEHAAVPVINGLTDFCHPCQALADALTITERKGCLQGVKIAYVGDGNNVANSLMFAAARLGAAITMASPAGYEPVAGVVEWTRREGAATGATCVITHDPVEAVTGADVVYTDVWTSMGQEEQAAARTEIFRPFQVNLRLLRHAKPDAMFMHCLPAHVGDEVTEEVMQSRYSVVFDQAENRLHAQKAILHELM